MTEPPAVPPVAPVAAMPPAPSPAADAATPGSTSDPAWAWPALFIGRVHPGLSEETRRDIRMLGALPIARFGLPTGAAGWIGAGIALALPVIFTFLRVGVTDVFTESLLFLGLAMVLGYVSPALGVVTVLAHGVLDLVVVLPSMRAAYDLPFGGPWWPIAGRLISFWLLWLLVVEVPLLTRSIRDHGFDLERRIPRELRRPGTVLVAAVVGAGLVFVWTQGVPLLIRPVFIWSDFGSPTLSAIQPIQESGTILVLVGGLLAGLVVVLRTATLGAHSDIETAVDGRSTDRVGSNLAGNRGLAVAGRFVSYGLIILGVGGLVSGLFDVVLLAVTLLATPYIATFIATRVPYRRPLARIPVVVRFLIGFAITYVIGLVITGITFDSALGSEFFPIVLIIAAGLIVFEILLGDVDAAEMTSSPPAGIDGATPDLPAGLPPIGAASIVAFVGVLAFLGFPGPVFADNCSSLSDCYGSAGAATAAAAAAAGVAGVVTITRLAGGLGRRGGGRGGTRTGPDGPEGAAGVSSAADGMVSGPTDAGHGAIPPAGGLATGGSLAGSFQQADLGDFVGAGGGAVGEDPGTPDREDAASAPAPPRGDPDGGATQEAAERAAGSGSGIGPAGSVAGATGGVGAFLQADLADFTASGGAEQGKAADAAEEAPSDSDVTPDDKPDEPGRAVPDGG